jgi:conjugal transfer/entry exclusion protein
MSKSYGSDVRVSKAGGVAAVEDPKVLYPDPTEVSSLIHQQRQSMESFAKDRDSLLRSAALQEQLENEAKQLLAQNGQRLMQAREAVKAAEHELALGMEREKQFGT